MVAGFALVAMAIAGPRDDVQQATGTTMAPTGVVAANLAPGTTAPLDGGKLGEGVAPEANGRTTLRGFGEVFVTITSGGGRICKLCLLSAVTVAQRQRGLMEVTDRDLGGYDGMLFEFPTEVSGSFWMRNTPQPLALAYFDSDGVVVSTVSMTPCGDSGDCVSYPATGPFQYALEVPEGDLAAAGVVGNATLRIEARTCPLAVAGTPTGSGTGVGG